MPEMRNPNSPGKIDGYRSYPKFHRWEDHLNQTFLGRFWIANFQGFFVLGRVLVCTGDGLEIRASTS